ncbi:uncharacterized protein LOC116299006 [Actinia tenebrosa]|uniref:Uncharacterized protein LOC116299006 n=1 Tax=Actinia tenebrosa TaxID=6105 RepID=A0A6P8ICK1_ACTTE|nr:uncharacterized protein LOC116299006 [Actinia tenebrosa]
MAEFVGKRLRIKTEEGTYEGIVHSIDPVKQRLTLSKVLSCTEGKAPKTLHGFHNFFGHELSNLEILRDEGCEGDDKELPRNEAKEKEVEKNRENGFNTNATHHRHHHSTPASYKPSSGAPKVQPTALQSSMKQQPSETAAMSAVFKNAVKDAGIQMKKTKKPSSIVTRDASDEGTTMLHRSPLAPERYLMDDYYSDDDMNEVSPQNPPKKVVIQEYGDHFNNAIKYISSQRVVGLSCEGIHLGRYGKVCWLVIGCRQFTYLFDVISLGTSCFDEGLGGILENANILKVIHDCRQISDALYHQYSIKLVNVFDTQVADIIIFQKEKGGQLPRVVNGLVGCLYEYLNLSPEECHFQKIRINNMQKDELIWSRRPLSQPLLDACAKHVMYLRELRLAQMERMLAEFIFGVDVYLSVIRDDKDLKPPDKKNMNKGRLVPQEFQKLYRFQHRRRNRKFDEEVHDATDEDDSLSHRNAWQEGQVFSEAYKDKHGRLREQSIRPDLYESSGRGSYGDWGTGPDNIELRPNFSDNKPHLFESSGRGSYGDRGTGPDNIELRPSFLDDKPRLFESSGRGSYFGRGTETGRSKLPPGFSDNRHQLYREEESDGSSDLSNASLGDNMAANYSDYSDTSSSRPDHPPNFFNDENAFYFKNPEELGSLRHDTIPDNRSAAVREYSSSPNACAMENTADRLVQLNFRDEDFPPLSSSQSSNSPSSPKSRPNTAIHSDSRSIPSTMRDNTRPLPAVSRGQSPLVRDAIATVGRGRGSLFQLLQHMPRARLPRLEQTNEPSGGTGSTYGVGQRVHAFPTDEELFASPEITHVSDTNSVRGGTRVWVRKT